MRLWPVLLFAFLLALSFGIAAPEALATETDQFTLPPEPLDDLGPDLGAIVLEILHSEIAQLNAGIDSGSQLNPKAASEPIKEREFVTHIYEQTGVGLPGIDGGARAPLRHVCRAQRPLSSPPTPIRSTRGSRRRFRCPT